MLAPAGLSKTTVPAPAKISETKIKESARLSKTKLLAPAEISETTSGFTIKHYLTIKFYFS